MYKTPIFDIRIVVEDHIILAHLFPFSIWENTEHTPASHDVKGQYAFQVNVIMRMSIETFEVIENVIHTYISKLTRLIISRKVRIRARTTTVFP